MRPARTQRVNYLLWIDAGGTVVENCLNCTVLLPRLLYYRAGLLRISALVLKLSCLPGVKKHARADEKEQHESAERAQCCG